MPVPTARLAFFKLNVPDLEAATAFWREAFGFEVLSRFDEAEFREHVMAIPSQGAAPNLMLVQYKDGRAVTVGPGHGPVGLICDDIRASHDQAVACHAESVTGVFEAAGIKIAVLKSPQGHEIELIQLSG
jgi:catechol 2,3-dioxygenase-like lactoylglutathione lyase family enzyme